MSSSFNAVCFVFIAHIVGNKYGAAQDYYPCNNRIVIGIDVSNSLEDLNFKTERYFLVMSEFNKWTHFDRLLLLSYAGRVNATRYGFFKDRKQLQNYVRGIKQSDRNASLCSVFKYLSTLNQPIPNVILFASFFNSGVVDSECKDSIDAIRTRIQMLTFIHIGSNVKDLAVHFPQAQIVDWYIEVWPFPVNWPWTFVTAYSCNEGNSSVVAYPCDTKIIVGFSTSSELASEIYQKQRTFLLNRVFSPNWSIVKNLALVIYNHNANFFQFNRFLSLNEIKSPIEAAKQVPNTPSVLCSAFKEMAAAFLHEINILLFVTKFDAPVSENCTSWTKRIADNVNSITFVSIGDQVNIDLLLQLFPQARLLNWNATVDEMPTNWDVMSQAIYGCDRVDSNIKEYPCPQKVAIGYDNTNQLSLRAFQRQTRFLMDKIFIEQWTQFNNSALFTYIGDNVFSDYGILAYLTNLKAFIRENSKTNQDISTCNLLGSLISNALNKANVVMFISKFDVDLKCDKTVNAINAATFKITFIALSTKINTSYILKTISNSNVIIWDVENQETPTSWQQSFWKSFGCYGRSPLLPPVTTTQIKTSTKQLTTTALQLFTYTTVKTIGTSVETSTSTSKSTTVLNHHTTTVINQNSNSSKELAIILLSIFIPLFVILICIIVVVIWRCKKQNRQNLLNVLVSNFARAAKNGERELNDPWKIKPECLVVNYIDKIGSGSFGDVYLGKLLGDAPITSIYGNAPLLQQFKDCTVAVKTLPALATDDFVRLEFQREIDFMKTLKFHAHIVFMLGYVSSHTNPLLVLELCSNGDLLNFLRKNKNKFVEKFENQEDRKFNTLITFAWQISSGLEYLSSLDLIHRDVALRNVLLDGDMRCKISDFGLCRSGSDNQVYITRGGKLPVRWMSIEALKTFTYSQKSDVWAYAILLYEMFSLGDVPYQAMDNAQILEFLESGNRLNKPRYCSDEIYELMQDCWLLDPSDRPTFTEICRILTKPLENASLHYNYVAIRTDDEIEVDI